MIKDLLFSIFVFPLYSFTEALFDNLFIITSQNYWLISFIFAFIFSSFSFGILHTALRSKNENSKTEKKDFLFIIFSILIFCSVLCFYKTSFLIKNVSLFQLSPFILVFNIIAVNRIYRHLLSQNINIKPIRDTSFGMFLFFAVMTWNTTFVFQILQLIISVLFLLYAFCFTSKNSCKNIKILFYSALTISVFPVLQNLIFNNHIQKLMLSEILILSALLIFMAFTLLFVSKKTNNFQNLNIGSLFSLTALSLFIWCGIYISSMIIGSSPTEFCNIGNVQNPLYFILITGLQYFSLCILYPYLIYSCLNEKYKNIAVLLLIMLLFSAIFNINSTVLSGCFNSLSVDLKLNVNTLFSDNLTNITNTLLTVVISLIPCLLILKEKQNLLKNIIGIILFIGLTSSFLNIAKIVPQYNAFKKEQNEQAIKNKNNIPSITLSKNGKNVLIIFTDRAISGFVQDIFRQNPELKNIYKGFTYYPNTVSFYGHTILGYPPMIAGYEYTPEEMNKRTDKKMKDKYNEALLMLPVMFKNNGFISTVTEPPYENYEIKIKDGKIFAKYGINHPIPVVNLDNFPKFPDNQDEKLLRNFSYFNLFVTTPLILKNYAYQEGVYKKIRKREMANIWEKDTKYEYLKLASLKNETEIKNDNNNYFNVFNSDLIHINNYDIPYVAEHFELEKIAFVLIGKYLEYLKSENLYDNTRIIIVSDHGHWEQRNSRLNTKYTSFNPVLMVKDFNSQTEFKEDMTFMTNADAPIFAVKDVIKNPVNPFTGKNIEKEVKKDKIRIFTEHNRNTPKDYQGTTSLIKGLEYLEVKDNIFDDKNWTKGIL